MNPLQGAPQGLVDEVVEFDYQLADAPLELPIGPEPNVMLINDDSQSMQWDLSTSEPAGLYFFPEPLNADPNSTNVHWVLAASVTNVNPAEVTKIAPGEEQYPGQGFWTLRSAAWNKIYYDPEVRYQPWSGLDLSDVPWPDSPPTAARHYPWLPGETTNLTQDQAYTGRAMTEVSVCTRVKGKNVCNTEWHQAEVPVTGLYLPRYYLWDDKDGDGEVDRLPSPFLPDGSQDPDSEGVLVEIRAGNTYPRGADRSDCQAQPDSCSYTEELQNFANWFTYARTRELTAKMALGRVVAKAEGLRIGYAKLNIKTGNKRIISMNTSERTGAKAAVLDAIYQTPAVGGTPLRGALRGAGRYFGCQAGDIFDSAAASALGTVDAEGYAICPTLPAPAGNCQQNYALMVTDGTWSDWDWPSIGEQDQNPNSRFDGHSYAGRNDNTLADVAMAYYEWDLHWSLPDQVATTARDIGGAAEDAFSNGGNEYMHQHMTTYTVGFGVSGFIDAMPPRYDLDYFEWGDPYWLSEMKIDDVRHAAYNGRGDYLDASSMKELTAALNSTFEEFSQGSGSSSAVSFNSQELQAGTLVFRAFYNTRTNAGELIAQSITPAGLVADPVWTSGATMDAKAATDRTIITLDRLNHVGVPFRAASLNADQRNAIGATDQVADRVNYLRGDASLERPFGSFRERPVEAGRLGDIVHAAPVFVGVPDRQGRDNVPYPQTDQYSAFRSSNATRSSMVYVAANDGMLHGFDANNGEELLAYLPNSLLLGDYSTKVIELLNYQYSHRYLFDLTPALNDVYIDADGDGSQQWATLLVAGQGGGAKAYVGLNVTNPDAFSEAAAATVALWEFTDADDTYPTVAGVPLTNADGSQRQDLQDFPKPVKDLGYSFSMPTIAMSNLLNSRGEHEWVAFFGNGFNSTAGIAKLFVLFVDHGRDGTWCHPDMVYNQTLTGGSLPTECVGKQDFVKIDTGFGVQGGYPNGLGTPRGIDSDGNGTVDFAYAGDSFGNLYRFDMRSSDFNEWTSTKIFKAQYEDKFGVITPQSITSQPIVTPNPTQTDGYMVIFSTGSYVTEPDASDETVQSIYGIWDRLSPQLITADELVQQRFTNINSATYGGLRSLSSNPLDYSGDGSDKGWFINLDVVAAGNDQDVDPPEFPGERAVRNIQIRGGVAFVNSVIPRGIDSCVDVDGGFSLSFCPGTGGADCFAAGGVFDLTSDGHFNVADQVNGVMVAGMRFQDAVPSDSAFINNQRVTQLSDQSLDMTATNTQVGANIGRLSWRQVDSID